MHNFKILIPLTVLAMSMFPAAATGRRTVDHDEEPFRSRIRNIRVGGAGGSRDPAPAIPLEPYVVENRWGGLIRVRVATDTRNANYGANNEAEDDFMTYNDIASGDTQELQRIAGRDDPVINIATLQQSGQWQFFRSVHVTPAITRITVINFNGHLSYRTNSDYARERKKTQTEERKHRTKELLRKYTDFTYNFIDPEYVDHVASELVRNGWYAPQTWERITDVDVKQKLCTTADEGLMDGWFTLFKSAVDNLPDQLTPNQQQLRAAKEMQHQRRLSHAQRELAAQQRELAAQRRAHILEIAARDTQVAQTNANIATVTGLNQRLRQQFERDLRDANRQIEDNRTRVERLELRDHYRSPITVHGLHDVSGLRGCATSIQFLPVHDNLPGSPLIWRAPAAMCRRPSHSGGMGGTYGTPCAEITYEPTENRWVLKNIDVHANLFHATGVPRGPPQEGWTGEYGAVKLQLRGQAVIVSPGDPEVRGVRPGNPEACAMQ